MVLFQWRPLASFAALFLIAAPAAAQNNVSLQNLTARDKSGATVVSLARVDLVNTNLSRDEVAKLFAIDATADAVGLAARLSADSVTITGASIVSEGGKISLGPIQALGVRQGRFAKLALDGFSGAFSDTAGGGGGVISGRALVMEEGNLAPLLAAIQTNSFETGAAQVGRVVWDGFDAAFTDSEASAGAPGNQIKVQLQRLTLTSEFSGDIPLGSKFEATGVVLEPAPASDFGKGLRAFGYERIELGLSGAGRYDPAAQKLSLQDYTIAFPQAGRLSVSGEMSGIDAAALTSSSSTQRNLALLGASVDSAKLEFENAGLVEKSFAFAAASQGRSPAALRTEVSSMAAQLLPLLLGGDPQSLALAQAVQTFLAAPRNFTLSMTSRGAPAPLARLAAIRDPASFFALVNVTLTANQ